MLFLIPTWVLLVEIAVLEYILLRVYFANKGQTVGKIAGTLAAPLAYVFVTYFILNFVTLEVARILARYAFSVMFFSLILIFGRFLFAEK